MSEIYTNGSWKPNPGSEETFVEAWTQFAAWASSMPGAGKLRLVRDLHESGLFVSFGDWESIEQVHDWKSSPEFRQRMDDVREHVAEFHPTELTLIATAEHGSTTSVEAPAGTPHA